MIQNSSTDNVEIRKEYYKSGVLRCETPHVNGKKHGISRIYYKSGALELETPFVKRKEHGIVKSYYESGDLKQETPYVNGKRHGIEKSYEEDRTCISRLVLYHVGVWKSTLGKPICEWKVTWEGVWDSEGILRISGAFQ